MVSRTDTVNLANMSAISEEVYTPSYTESTDLVSWLSSKFSELTTGEADKWKITRFEKTPPMSTYIVAYATGPFQCIEGSYTSPISKKEKPVRVWSETRLVSIQCVVSNAA